MPLPAGNSAIFCSKSREIAQKGTKKDAVDKLTLTIMSGNDASIALRRYLMKRFNPL